MYFGLLVFFLLVGLWVVELFCSKLSVCAVFSLFSFPLVSWDFLFCLDSVSVLGGYMLFSCSLVAFVYCFHYFSGGSDSYLLFPLMVWFVGVMALLMFSNSFVFTLVMWEFLGFVSFLLILFYSNSSSLRASLITLFSSRFGDVALFGLVSLLFYYTDYLSTTFVFICFLLVVVTKSASVPFVSWLLEAMRAPTPVSSLVHSSTLVAAGVWFIVRYGEGFPEWGYIYLFLGSLFTIYITGLCAVFFSDLKKIVALSTCNNVAWCLIYYCCGDWWLVMFQLLVHGLSKCVLFMFVGDVMSGSSGAQNYVGVYSSRYSSVYSVLILCLLIFSLCGLPFVGIFFIKHFFLVGVVSLGLNLFSVFLLFLGFFLSYLYSSRFALILLGSGSGLSSGYVVFYLLAGAVSFLGTLVGYFLVLGVEEFEDLGIFLSSVFLLIQVGGVLCGYFFYVLSKSGSFWDSVLWGNDGLVGFCYSLLDKVGVYCVLSFYRWEVYLLSSVFGKLRGVRWVYLSVIFSFNFVIMGVFYFLFVGAMLF